jgi:hypothetical protein
LLKALFPGQVEWVSHPINQFIARQKVPNIYLGSLFFNLFSKTKRFENAAHAIKARSLVPRQPIPADNPYADGVDSAFGRDD